MIPRALVVAYGLQVGSVDRMCGLRDLVAVGPTPSMPAPFARDAALLERILAMQAKPEPTPWWATAREDLPACRSFRELQAAEQARIARANAEAKAQREAAKRRQFVDGTFANVHLPMPFAPENYRGPRARSRSAAPVVRPARRPRANGFPGHLPMASRCRTSPNRPTPLGSSRARSAAAHETSRRRPLCPATPRAATLAAAGEPAPGRSSTASSGPASH